MGVMALSQKIKAVRQEKRLTQADVAAKLDITPAFYQKLEKRGEKLSVEQVQRIAEALGLTMLELLTYGEEADLRAGSKDLNKLQERIEELKREREMVYERINLLILLINEIEGITVNRKNNIIFSIDSMESDSKALGKVVKLLQAWANPSKRSINQPSQEKKE